MSTALAVASVTAVLQKIISEALSAHDVSVAVNASVQVSALAPDRIKTGDDETPRLNLFMYHVTPNLAWRNAELASRDGEGQRLTNPPLALDLQYLLTAYGKQDLDQEILLGHAVQALHETPVLTRQTVGDLLQPPSLLATSGLADQVEIVKLTPQTISTEEMSRLWSALQAHYRPTAAYQASVVLIEERGPTRRALPVHQRNLKVIPFRQPRIEEVVPAEGPDQPVIVGSTVRIIGQNLRGEITRVRIGEVEVVPQSVTDTEIGVPIDAPLVPVAALRAGVMPIQVVQPTEFPGTPSPEHRGFESNVVAFVLLPVVDTDPGGNFLINKNLAADTGGTFKGNITLTLKPAVTERQRVIVLFNPNVVAEPHAYSFDAAVQAVDPRKVDAAISRVAPGEYFVRIQVDGAESPIDLDPASPTFGPAVIIP